MAVARLVSKAGRTVRVFEARDRVGGRLLSEDALDLGATWFWANEPRVNALNAELGLATHDQSIDGDAMYQNQKVERLSGNPVDAPAGRWTNGGQSLTTSLHAELPAETVLFHDPVSAIESIEGAVRLTSANGQCTASHVVLAVPPSLAIARIEFSPGLDDGFAELARVTPVWMGSTAKVVAHYPSAFWRVDGRSGSAFSHDGPMRELHDMSGPDGSPAAIFGFAGGGAGTAPTEREALDQLVALFGPEAAEPTDLIIKDWSVEEWTSPADVGQHTNYQTYGHAAYAQPMLDGRLHWTSTETSPVAPGHVEGALAAAERTAQAILAS